MFQVFFSCIICWWGSVLTMHKLVPQHTFYNYHAFHQNCPHDPHHVHRDHDHVVDVVNRSRHVGRHLHASQPCQLHSSQFQPAQCRITITTTTAIVNRCCHIFYKTGSRCSWWVTRARWSSPSTSSCGRFAGRGSLSFTPSYQVGEGIIR